MSILFECLFRMVSKLYQTSGGKIKGIFMQEHKKFRGFKMSSGTAIITK